MRRFFQWCFLGLFTLLFILAGYLHLGDIPVDLFLRADPLIAIGGMISQRGIIAGLSISFAVLLLTLIFGRFICGYVCPMGALIDIFDPLFGPHIKRRGIKANSWVKRLRFPLLIIILTSSVFGLSLLYLLDPIVILTRFYALVGFPLVISILNGLLDLIRPLAYQIDWTALSYKSYFQPLFSSSLITLLIFGGILSLNAYTPRFWCRYLCPLGALFSFFSRYGLYKRFVNEYCNNCQKCIKACPMEAIEQDAKKVRTAECLQCRTCELLCPKEAISLKPRPLPVAEDLNPGLDVSRRRFLYSVGIGVALPVIWRNTPLHRLRHLGIIRPPGALPEKDFLSSCIRCGECMRACLTNTIQPSLFESGLEGLWTPKLLMRYAACEQNCNICGKVCPTHALRKLSMKEKKHARIGTAVLLRDRCLVWRQDKLCLICDEQCPYNAIIFKTVDGMRRPYVVEDKCNGCGNCELKCPIEGQAAIIVSPLGEIRLKDGSYVKEAKRLKLEFNEQTRHSLD